VSRTRLLALLGVLVVWAAVAYGNVALQLMNPVLLPTPGQVASVFMDTVRGPRWRSGCWPRCACRCA
jgi:ABC-type nitrate/sulfonate/bicarbonate transport system permease component